MAPGALMGYGELRVWASVALGAASSAWPCRAPRSGGPTGPCATARERPGGCRGRPLSTRRHGSAPRSRHRIFVSHYVVWSCSGATCFACVAILRCLEMHRCAHRYDLFCFVLRCLALLCYVPVCCAWFCFAFALAFVVALALLLLLRVLSLCGCSELLCLLRCRAALAMLNIHSDRFALKCFLFFFHQLPTI